MRTNHTRHFPARGSRDDLRAGEVDHATPYRRGAHAVCGACGRRIVFVEGYELRQDYWRAASKKEGR